MSDFGYCEDETCNRKCCKGSVKEHPVENCSCHSMPPCGPCTYPRGYCESCGWEESEDQVINDFVVSIDSATGIYRSWEPRPLDASKIDWHSKSHTNSSMIKEGVYPDHLSCEEVEREVRGTFGGRFEYFGKGKFKYIAYTD